jgi:hypothetical protein
MNLYQNHAAMQGHIAQWQASSLSQTEFCKEHGIKPHIFSYYKKSSVRQQNNQVNWFRCSCLLMSLSLQTGFPIVTRSD